MQNSLCLGFLLYFHINYVLHLFVVLLYTVCLTQKDQKKESAFFLPLVVKPKRLLCFITSCTLKNTKYGVQKGCEFRSFVLKGVVLCSSQMCQKYPLMKKDHRMVGFLFPF